MYVHIWVCMRGGHAYGGLSVCVCYVSVVRTVSWIEVKGLFKSL